MNKKKKTTRIKHRKNKERMKNLLQASLLKAKPKRIVSTPKVVVAPNTEAKDPKKSADKKAIPKKAAAKKTTTKKTAAKKTTTKKKT